MPPEPEEPPQKATLLDVRGTFCPIPILKAAEAIDQLPEGARLHLLGDDPGILEDLPAWCDQTGHLLLGMLEHQGVIRCMIQKRTGGVPPAEP